MKNFSAQIIHCQQHGLVSFYLNALYFDEINASLFRNNNLEYAIQLSKWFASSSVYRLPFACCFVIHPLSCFMTLFRQLLSDRDQIVVGRNFVSLFCCFTSKVNRYGHGGTVSSHNHTFSLASLNKQLTSTSCIYLRL